MVWFQNLNESRQLPDWDQFIKHLLIRFGPNCYDDPIEAIIKLRKTSSVEDYKAKFETLSNRLKGLSNQYKLSYFLSGLRDEICLPVRIFAPSNITTAYSLSKLSEENLSLTKKVSKTVKSLTLILLPNPNYHSKKPINPKNKLDLDEREEG